MGGGTHTRTSRKASAPGPSPRGRGNHASAPEMKIIDGTIPAWAGEPPIHMNASGTMRDHPRVGGGTLPLIRSATGDQGPSPRGRGNRTYEYAYPPNGRTIPAWAGEPNHVAPRRQFARDHPRVGGGTPWMPLTPGLMLGPSPRGRGNHPAFAPSSRRSGTIPAWAGEPSAVRQRLMHEGDHPRVGGGTGGGGW